MKGLPWTAMLLVACSLLTAPVLALQPLQAQTLDRSRARTGSSTNTGVHTKEASAVTLPQPALAVVASAGFFEHASRIAVQLLRQKFKKRRFMGDFETDIHIPVVGTVHFTLRDVWLNGLDISAAASGLTLVGEDVLQLSVTGLRADVGCKFHYKQSGFPGISGGGHADIYAVNGQVKLAFSLLNDGEGHAQMVPEEMATTAFEDLQVHVSDSKLAWLYNAVLTLAKDVITSQVQEEISQQVTAAVPLQSNLLLTHIPTLVPVKGLYLNVSMAGDPVVTPSALVLQDWGQFQAQKGSPCPFMRSRTASNQASQQMLTSYVDESVVNCFTWALYQRGLLDRRVGHDELPGHALYTETWRFAIPQLSQLHPNASMDLMVHVPEPPTTQIDGQGVVVTGDAILAFHLAQQGDEPDLGPHLFTVKVTAQLIASTIKFAPDVPERPYGWRLVVLLKVLPHTPSVVVVGSDIGPIDETRLQFFFTLLANLVEAKINGDILKDGIALPDIPHIRILQPTLALQNQTLALSGDLAYVPVSLTL